jgi:hypothetical protein
MDKASVSSKAMKAMLEAGRRAKNVEHGSGSWLADLAGFVTGMRPSKRKGVADFLHTYQEGLRKGNEAAGGALAKIPGVGRIFKTVEKVPLESKAVNKAGVTEIQQRALRPTAKLTAPLEKVRKPVLPILAYMGATQVSDPMDPDLLHEQERRNQIRAALKEQETKMGQVKVSENRELIKQAVYKIESQQKQIDWLVDKLAHYMQLEEAEKVAGVLADRGFFPSEEVGDYKEKLARLSNLSSIAKFAEVIPAPVRTVPLTDPTADQEKTASDESDGDPVIEHLLTIMGRK